MEAAPGGPMRIRFNYLWFGLPVTLSRPRSLFGACKPESDPREMYDDLAGAWIDAPQRDLVARDITRWAHRIDAVIALQSVALCPFSVHHLT